MIRIVDDAAHPEEQAVRAVKRKDMIAHVVKRGSLSHKAAVAGRRYARWMQNQNLRNTRPKAVNVQNTIT